MGYIRYHRLAITICYNTFLIQMISAHFKPDPLQYIQNALVVYYFMWGLFEAFSFAYRDYIMPTPFDKYVVICKLMITKDHEKAVSIAKDIAVMSVMRAYKLYDSWWHEVRSWWCFMVISPLIIYFVNSLIIN